MMEGLALREPDGQLAFAPETVSSAKLAETMVALANARGGTLVIGVPARGGKPSGLSDAEDVLSRALQAAASVDPPLIVPLPRIVVIDGSSVVEVAIPRGLAHVYGYKGKYLVRDGLQNRPLNPRRLRSLIL